MASGRRWWRAWIARRLRKIRDSCRANADQLWDCVALHWLGIGWGVLMVSFFFILAHRLQNLPTREQQIDREMEQLELIDSPNSKSPPCSKR
jgi:hypothetical protein